MLIVDDHADTRELHLLLITDAGYRCVAAESTDEGLRLARLTRFDVVVMDLGLPRREDGVALARSLRALPDPPALIALSGFPKRPDTAGLFFAELVKPVDPHEVLAAVNRATNT